MSERRTSSTNPVSLSPQNYVYSNWREHFVRPMLIGAMVFGLIALVPAVLSQPNIIIEGVFVTAYILLFTLTVFKFPYWLRMGAFLTIIYALGMSELFSTGILGDAVFFFLAFMFLTTMMFSPRAGMIAGAINILTYVTMGWLTLSGRVGFLDNHLTATVYDWISASASTILMGSVIIIGLQQLQIEFLAAQKQTAEVLQELNNERGKLEDRVEERTNQLKAVNEVGRTASAILNPEELISRVVNLITDQFGYYYTAIFLTDDNSEWAELHSATGEAGRILKEGKHKLRVGGNSMVGTAISLQQARIALDTGAESVRFENPLLPYTRSEIALPLTVGSRTIGALDVQSTKEAAFGTQEIETLQGMANQVAIAFENARLFARLESNLVEMQTIQRQYVTNSWRPLSNRSDLQYNVGDDEGLANSTNLQIPIMLRDEIIGAIDLAGDTEWTPEQRNLVETVATQAALALENARLIDESQTSAAIEHLLAEITGKVWSATTVDGILQTAVRELGRALDASEAVIELEKQTMEMDHNNVLKNPDEFDLLSNAPFDYQGWREGFLRIVLRISSLMGLVIALVAYPTTPPTTLVFFAIAYLVLLLATFLPRLTYWMRGGVFLALIFWVGFRALLGWGPWADANIFFAAFVALTALLFDPNMDLGALGVTVFSIAFIGTLNLTGLFHLSGDNVPSSSVSDWLIYGFDFGAMSLVMIWPIRLFKREFSNIAAQTKKIFDALISERTQLEERVRARTQELEKQTNQLRASALITRYIADIQDIQQMLTQAAALISEQFRYYHVGIFLADDQFRTAFMQAASSETGRGLIARGYKFELVEQNFIGRVAIGKKPIILVDNGNSEFSINDPDMPLTRSRIGVPLTTRGKVIGVLDIHSERSQAFDQGDAEIFRLLADQIAGSIENVRLMDESRAVVSELEMLTSQQSLLSWKNYTENRALVYQFTPTGVKQIAQNSGSKEKADLNIPLRLRGQEIGTISLQRKDISQWTEVERDLVEKVASQIALALENSRLLEETRRRASQQQTVSEISARLGRSLDVDTLLQTAARELGSLPEIAEVSVYIEPIAKTNQKK